ncbi:hypothetical protein DFH09DRAFT_1369151 [Mycena vulgaris]|nr:hypothetical protein DFH09DRAFT_1369151 [Mycena vulgaris]
MNPTSLLSRFPQELIDKVIEENGGDTPTLRSCALVCRSFLPSSQARIFSHIDLIAQSTPFRYTRQLHLILQDSPHLSTHVRSLRIVGFDGAFRSLIVDPRLVAVLLMLNALTSFDFEMRDIAFQWSTLPNALRVAICELCQRSHLVKLRLFNLGTLALHEFTSIIASPALKDLTLMNIEFPALTAAHGAPTLARCNLKLQHSSLDAVNGWLAERGGFARLQQLDVLWNPKTTSGVQLILDASSSSLEELHLRITAANYSSMAHIPFTSNSPVLRVLLLTFLLRIVDNATIVPWLVALLQTHQCPSPLSKISIHIYLMTALDPDPVAHPAPLNPPIPTPFAIDWTPLADVLAARQFPALRRVALDVVSLSAGSDDRLREIVDGAKRGLPDLDTRGVLQCTTQSSADERGF